VVVNVTLGERLKNARKTRGITQKELAASINVAENTISQYENNKREPSIATLNKMTFALNVSAAYLMGLSENKVRFHVELPDIDNDPAWYTVDEDGREVPAYLTDRDKSIERIRTGFNYLNQEGIDKVYDFLRDIAEIPKYKREVDENGFIVD
jgi:transcriptional regulator with XRE-family HTH domain